ncbi:MAG: D-3-phosphoglycerate dehydrogenase / 2-oxoglutarate reductase [Actinomycetota bacterium]|nr:D-3-phosphoglycerate dehydrogenase / 2-oxoglutarate reductase [Actinomycetota bacterium]
MKVLVPESLSEEGLAKLGTETDVDARKLSRDELLEAIGDFDALVVRSATRVDKELLERATSLKVVGRAGVGLDNIDVATATRLGILVVNAPTSNVLSAAEHTMALLLSLARHIPAADASLRAGGWERERFTGVELEGKTLGILGLGRIGTLVAQRAAGFGMRLLGYDPYVSKQRATQLGIQMASSVEEVCREADFITVHLPKNAETKAILADPEFALMKPEARVINVARGGIVDEDALVRALKDGLIAGAAVDVYEKEPPGHHPLFDLEQVVVTPHLGASTEEAQTKAGTAIAEQVLLALRGEFAPYAVNVAAGGDFGEALRPFIPLTERLGRVLGGLAGAGLSAVRVEVYGAIADNDTRILTLAALKGLFGGFVHEPVTYVNAPLMAQERGIQVSETKSATSQDYVNLVVVRGESDDGPAGGVAVGGSLFGKANEEHLVRVYDFSIDMEPERYLCLLRYADRPGVIGKVGTVLGAADINIASIKVSRETIGGEALMGLTVDSPIPPEVVRQIASVAQATQARFIDLGS